MYYLSNKISKLVMVLVATVAMLLVHSFILARPAHAAVGGGDCDIDGSGGISGGDASLPAALKVKFVDANGNPIDKRVDFILNSYSDSAATKRSPNISQWTNSGGSNSWSGKSVDSWGAATCNRTDSNFTIFSWKQPSGSLFLGNGWLLFCHDHPSGNPSTSTGLPAYFNITNISPLPLGGGAGGGESGSWKMTGTTWKASNTVFTVTNGTTKNITFQWVPVYAKITINKYYNGSQASSAEFTTVKSATVEVYKNDGSYLYNSDSGWASNTLSGVPKTGNSYRIRFYIPAGYKVKNLQFGTAIVSCTTVPTSSGEKYCLTPTFNVDPPGVSTINAYYEKIISTTTPPYLVLQCDIGSNITDVSFVKPDRYYIRGYGVDSLNQDEPPNIILKEAGVTLAAYSGNLQNDSVYNALNALTYNGSKAFTGLKLATQYRLVQEIPDKLRDGKPHTIDVYLQKADGILWNATSMSNLTAWGGNPVTWSGRILLNQAGADPNCTIIPPVYFPWLQTKDGDVMASGKIAGQEVGSMLGARQSSATSKEADYLVMSYVGDSSAEFCSNYKYVLGNVSAVSTGSCANGGGYEFDSFDLGGAGTEDTIYNSVLNKYNELPAACKLTSLPAIFAGNSTTCAGGTIVKLTGPQVLPAITVSNGRFTLLVEGDVTINGNIAISSNNYTKLENLPQLAIVASGNVKIIKDVTSVESTIYSAGYINTCASYNATNQYICKKNLSVLGSLVAKNGFLFTRANSASYNCTTGCDKRGPGELISLLPLSALLPPPGLDVRSINGSSQSTVIDSAEYQPRF